MTESRLTYLTDGDVGRQTRKRPVHIALEISARVDTYRLVELDVDALLELTFWFSHFRHVEATRLKIANFTKIVVL